MRNKMLMMLFCVASFVGFTHVKLEAVSTMPSLLAINLYRGSTNGVTLSTNTLSMSVDVDISTQASETESQLIGFIEFNATKTTTNPAPLVITQLSLGDALNMPANANWPVYKSGASGNTDESDALTGPWLAMRIQSNIDPTSTTSYVVQAFADTAVVNVAGLLNANLTAVTTGTYANQMGILRFLVTDDPNNSLESGTYAAYYTFTIAAP
ncbi:MAG: hypothetical protein S4CHLAM20_15540 [Chlamydiia bacterium]|nr:hypothetical protein [Chlamydiia bacterium]